MLFFLHGKETYRLTRKLSEIEQQYRKARGNALNLEKLDIAKVSFQDFWDAFQQQSMFVEKKLFFLENVFSNEPFKQGFLKVIDEISKSQHIVVLIEKQALEKTDKLFRALQKTAKIQEFEPMSGLKLKNWIKKEFAKRQTAIEPMALAQLINCLGNNLWQLSQETKKLSAYRRGQPSSTNLTRAALVTVSDINLFIKPKTEAQIFALTDALASGNKKTALQMLQNHFNKGDSPFYLLTMFAWQFRNLLLVKSVSGSPVSQYGYGRSNALGMNPFVFRKTSQLAQRFSFDQLKKIFQQILQTDLSVKIGKILPEQGLRMLIADM